MSINGSNLSIYVNGAMVGAPVVAHGQIVPSGNNLQIGHDPSNPPRYFNGLIDEAALYSTGLSAAQVQAIYNAGSAGKCRVPTPPLVAIQPASQIVSIGANAGFAGLASGFNPLAYQWQFGGSNIAGATAATLSLANVQLTNAGSYSLIVSNPYGFGTNSNALLTVTNPVCVSTPSNLVGWWAGEGNANDNTGTNNGFATNGVTYAAGKAGQAFVFNGSSTIQVPNSASLNFGPTAPITIEMWAFRTGATGNVNILGKRLAGCSLSFNYIFGFDPVNGLLLGAGMDPP